MIVDPQNRWILPHIRSALIRLAECYNENVSICRHDHQQPMSQDATYGAGPAAAQVKGNEYLMDRLGPN